MLGDIFVLNTPKGKAYLHYIYCDKIIGDLIRVLPGLYPDDSPNLAELAKATERYYISFPLTQAVKKKIISQAGHYPITGFTKPKLMRTEHNVRGKFLGWHIVDTDTWQRQLVQTLSDNQKKLSPWGIWNDMLLIERLTEGWTLESWQ